LPRQVPAGRGRTAWLRRRVRVPRLRQKVAADWRPRGSATRPCDGGAETRRTSHASRAVARRARSEQQHPARTGRREAASKPLAWRLAFARVSLPGRRARSFDARSACWRRWPSGSVPLPPARPPPASMPAGRRSLVARVGPRKVRAPTVRSRRPWLLRTANRSAPLAHQRRTGRPVPPGPRKFGASKPAARRAPWNRWGAELALRRGASAPGASRLAAALPGLPGKRVCRRSVSELPSPQRILASASPSLPRAARQERRRTDCLRIRFRRRCRRRLGRDRARSTVEGRGPGGWSSAGLPYFTRGLGAVCVEVEPRCIGGRAERGGGLGRIHRRIISTAPARSARRMRLSAARAGLESVGTVEE
jgi:hypothetical protein